MGTFIIKLHDKSQSKDYYLEWCTIVDAPITVGMSLDEFQQHYKNKYGTAGMLSLPERLKKVEEKGISAEPPLDNLEDIVNDNYAGKRGGTISIEKIIQIYCRDRLLPVRR